MPVTSWCHIYAAYTAVNEMDWSWEQQEVYYVDFRPPAAAIDDKPLRLSWGFWCELFSNGPWTLGMFRKLETFKELLVARYYDPVEGYQAYMNKHPGTWTTLSPRVQRWLRTAESTTETYGIKRKVGHYDGITCGLSGFYRTDVPRDQQITEVDWVWRIYEGKLEVSGGLEKDLLEMTFDELKRVVRRIPADEVLGTKKLGPDEDAPEYVRKWRRPGFWLRAMALKVWECGWPKWKGYENALAFLGQAAVVNGLVWRGCFDVWERFARSTRVWWQ